jgi:ribonuclease HI
VPNRGTDTALSEVTNAIESALENDEVALTVFLDIEGAFDNLQPSKALDLLDSWGADPAITNTLRNYYSKRKVSSHYSGNTVTLYPLLGSAQGNVLSPMLWNVIINKVADLLNTHNLGGAVLADDIAIVSRAPTPAQAAAKLQPILADIKHWLDIQGLKVSVKKSCTVCFHNPRTNHLNAPVLWGTQPIPQKSSTKYLGLIFDESLSWKPHFSSLLESTKKDLTTINHSLGKSWGPSPQLTLWTYTAVVRPKLAFAAHIWAGALDTHYLNQQSRKLQRWALTKLGPIREHTPTAGLEIITNTPPLQFYLQGVALKTYSRIKPLLHIQYATKGHLTLWRNSIQHVAPLASLPCDQTKKIRSPNFRNKHLIDLTSEPTSAKIFTDGSGTSAGFGSGFYLEWGNEQRHGCATNGSYYSVYLSEIRAITLAIEKFLTEPNTPQHVAINSDCLSAIKAINSLHSNSRAIQDCWKALQKLDHSHIWSLTWVKSHIGIEGNERADCNAKAGTAIRLFGPQPFTPLPRKTVSNAIDKGILKKWEHYWKNRGDCRQTKLWLPKPNHKFTKNLLSRSKQEVGLVIRWITGHCYLARHQSLIHGIDPTCNLCQDGEETPWHLLRECHATLHTRQNVLPHDRWDLPSFLHVVRQLSYLEVADPTATQ